MRREEGGERWTCENSLKIHGDEEMLEIHIGLNCKTNSTYLGRSSPQSSPVDARQDIDQKLRVDLDIIFGQLGLLGVQRERVVGRLAVLDRAGQKVECHDLHLGGF